MTETYVMSQVTLGDRKVAVRRYHKVQRIGHDTLRNDNAVVQCIRSGLRLGEAALVGVDREYLYVGWLRDLEKKE